MFGQVPVATKVTLLEDLSREFRILRRSMRINGYYRKKVCRVAKLLMPYAVCYHCMIALRRRSTRINLVAWKMKQASLNIMVTLRQSATCYLLMLQGKDFLAFPAGSCFNEVAQYKQLTLEEAEEKMKNRRKTADGYERWMMKAANNGPAAYGAVEKVDDRESGSGGVRGRKRTPGDDHEGNVSDRGEEDEAARKSRLGVNKKNGDDDDEGPRGGDLDFDDDDIEKAMIGSMKKFFDEAVGNASEERIDLVPEIPAPPEIKPDEEDEDEADVEEGVLSKSGKELKKP
ncbi:transcription initiation factor IIF subunit alpha-like isoform X2 [Primulina huaijiensis]|uniref:transcription initiation factor IIF subunit alpha-like isoform X2 n=1 Tax=Primulina huaijiensis TaxID=1492673 RepID=UPI003CC72B6A